MPFAMAGVAMVDALEGERRRALSEAEGDQETAAGRVEGRRGGTGLMPRGKGSRS